MPLRSTNSAASAVINAASPRISTASSRRHSISSSPGASRYQPRCAEIDSSPCEMCAPVNTALPVAPSISQYSKFASMPFSACWAAAPPGASAASAAQASSRRSGSASSRRRRRPAAPGASDARGRAASPGERARSALLVRTAARSASKAATYVRLQLQAILLQERFETDRGQRARSKHERHLALGARDIAYRVDHEFFRADDGRLAVLPRFTHELDAVLELEKLALEPHDRARRPHVPRDLLRVSVLEQHVVEHERRVVGPILRVLGVDPVQQPPVVVRLQHFRVPQVVARRALFDGRDGRRRGLSLAAVVPGCDSRGGEHAECERFEIGPIQREALRPGDGRELRFYLYSSSAPRTAARGADSARLGASPGRSAAPCRSDTNRMEDGWILPTLKH